MNDTNSAEETLSNSSQNLRKRSDSRISIIKSSFKNSFGKLKNNTSNKHFTKPVSVIDDNDSSKNNQESRKFEDFYEELDIIGEGAHAIVKKVHSKLAGTINAVKIIRTKDPEVIIAVKNEYMNSVCLNHPNIVKIHDLFIDEFKGKSYFVMEYLNLKSLDYYLKKQKKFSEFEVMCMMIQILKAVTYMHKKGICHRDLKPNNILIDPAEDFKVKIIDFDISKNFITYSFKNGYTSKSFSKMYTCTGTLVYCAPEIFNGEGYSHMVDLWAIGIIAYQLLSGTLPFRSDYVSETIDQITKKELDFTEAEWGNSSSLAKDFVRRLLKKDSKHRISAVDALMHPFLSNFTRPTFIKKGCSSPQTSTKKYHQTLGYNADKEYCSAHKMTMVNSKETFRIIKLENSQYGEEEKEKHSGDSCKKSSDGINTMRDFVDNIERRRKYNTKLPTNFLMKSPFYKNSTRIKPFDSMQNI